MADLQIENLKRTITHSGISVFNTPSIIQIPLISFCIRFSIVSISGLTEHEIGTLPDETRVYESVGRMFILSDKPTVTTRLTEKQSTCQEKVIFNQLKYMLNIVSEILGRTQFDARFNNLTYCFKIKTLESNKEYLERNLKESENSLRELVAQKMGSSGQ